LYFFFWEVLVDVQLIYIIPQQNNYPQAEESASLFAQNPGQESSSSSSSSGAKQVEHDEEEEDKGEEEEEGGIVNDDDAVASAVMETVEANTVVAEDIEVAWEVLEVARNILASIPEDDVARVRYCFYF
jgi:hypothetical protein